MTETPVWILLSFLTKSTSVLLITSPLLLDWPLLLLDLLVWVRIVLVIQGLHHQEQHCFFKEDDPGHMLFDMTIYTLTLFCTYYLQFTHWPGSLGLKGSCLQLHDKAQAVHAGVCMGDLSSGSWDRRKMAKTALPNRWSQTVTGLSSEFLCLW